MVTSCRCPPVHQDGLPQPPGPRRPCARQARRPVPTLGHGQQANGTGSDGPRLSRFQRYRMAARPPVIWPSLGQKLGRPRRPIPNPLSRKSTSWADFASTSEFFDLTEKTQELALIVLLNAMFDEYLSPRLLQAPATRNAIRSYMLAMTARVVMYGFHPGCHGHSRKRCTVRPQQYWELPTRS